MTDFVIVGGGIYGCGTAWELAQRGAEVLLLEAKTIASGASGGPGKRGVRANGRDRRELTLMRLAYRCCVRGYKPDFPREGVASLEFYRPPAPLSLPWPTWTRKGSILRHVVPQREWQKNQIGSPTIV